MGDLGKKYLAAAVQMAPVWLDREATTEKVCAKILELGKKGVRLIVFPEVMIPGTPHWNWTEPLNSDLYLKMFQNSVEVPSETLKKVAQACRSANAHVVLGITERESKALYNTIVFINNEGHLIGKHRKLVATHSEKVLWASGDATGLQVYDTPIGKIGGLICGEHNNSLSRYALGVQGEEVHAAVWVSGAARRGELYNRKVETWCMSYALANQTFVICAQSCASEEEIKRFGFEHSGGGSSIIAPDGSFLTGPEKNGETDVIAEIDFEQAIRHYSLQDTIIYHGRPDIFNFSVNREKPSHKGEPVQTFEKYNLAEYKNEELSKI